MFRFSYFPFFSTINNFLNSTVYGVDKPLKYGKIGNDAYDLFNGTVYILLVWPTGP